MGSSFSTELVTFGFLFLTWIFFFLFLNITFNYFGIIETGIYDCPFNSIATGSFVLI